jgi:hypothetical protein
MTIKITLITPPDIYQNSNDGIFLINLSEAEQLEATRWLGAFETEQDVNIYFYQGETDTPWFLHSLASSKYKYIELHSRMDIGFLMASYLLSKPNTFYSSTDPNLLSMYNYINQNQVSGIVDFFERTLGAEKQQ